MQVNLTSVYKFFAMSDEIWQNTAVPGSSTEVDKSTSLEGGSEKKPWDDQGGFKKMKGKNKEIIIAHPLDKLWMLPYILWLIFFFQ